MGIEGEAVLASQVCLFKDELYLALVKIGQTDQNLHTAWGVHRSCLAKHCIFQTTSFDDLDTSDSS